MPDRPAARIPVATYRLQFNHRFTFREATRIIGYLRDLGISDIYASPYFKAKAGSLHGYDIVDHNAMNPEIGAEEDYSAMVAELKRHGMGQILDIVPNHMCVDCTGNAWWEDVLENGSSSQYASYFDVDWAPVKKELKDKVLIPVLGDQYGNVLENGELTLAFEEGAFFVSYYDHRFPLRPQTYTTVLEYRLQELAERFTEDKVNYEEHLSIITALKNLPLYTETDPSRIEERRREKEVIKRRLSALVGLSPEVREHIEENVRLFNGTRGDHRSFDLLDGLLNQQIYRLSHWRVATEEINYRRFFDINGLGAVRMERADVFRETHRLIFRLVREGKVTGLRIDHPDGLYNPAEYFYRLQRGCFIQQMLRPGDEEPELESALARQYDEAVMAEPEYKPFYIVGEKILTKAERMPEDWPIFSTTGYVFLNSVNGVFIESGHAKVFDGVYEKFIRQRINIQDLVVEKKKLVMQVAMASEINMISHYLNDLSEKNRHTRDFTLNSIRNAVVEVIACFPVYRTYINTWSVSDRDRQVVELAVSKAKRRNPAISETVFDFVKDALLLRFPADVREEDKWMWLDFVMRFQQITGPVMAKGVEDTAFYVYNRLVSLNEVGGMPERFGVPLETFHGQNIERQKSWPHALITTATHDTKRGEDTRQKINVLSELPQEWAEQVRTWARLNAAKKSVIDGREAPDRNEEYLLYQALLGAWPDGAVDDREMVDLRQRIGEYMIKACREAKINTSWIAPNEKYEKGVLAFVDALLKKSEKNRFLNDFLLFQQVIAHYSRFNSLSQVVLKISSPGVPDFYQGTELWDYSLVDPDNRRPVDYEKRIIMLEQIKKKEAELTGTALAWELMQNIGDGRIKLYIVRKALNFRRANFELFAQGDYLPLWAKGAKAGHVCAFARRKNGASAIVAVPRLLVGLISGAGALPIGKGVWENTVLELPEAAPGEVYRNVFTGEIATIESVRGEKVLSCPTLFSSFPVALLERM